MADKKNFRIISRDEMKPVDVIFVSDDLVGELILSRKEYERQQQRKLKEQIKDVAEEEPVTPKVKKRKGGEGEKVTPKKPKLTDDLELQLAALEKDEVEKEPVRQSSTLFDEEGDIAAEKMYTFQAKKTYGRSPLLKTASPRIPITTPKAKSTSIPLERIEEESSQPQTPYSLRKRVISDIKEIQKILENSDEEKDFSPSGSEYSGDEESEEDETETKGGKSYFELQNSRKSKSNRSVSNKAPLKLTREAVDNVFKELKIGEAHNSHMTQLFRTQVALFDKWDFLLRHNYNILLYGVGSKKDLIDRFLSRFSKSCPIVKVNGFFPSVTVKDILDQVCDCLKLDASGSNVLERIESKLNDYDVKIYIGINNIDGVMLRSKKNQQTLARLARVAQIRLVASIDHINAPLMWDQCVVTDLNWAWMDATTFIPYTEETSYENSILLHPSGQLTLASLRSVFNSLTRNARELFLILARTQVAAEKGWLGMAFRELYHEGRRQLLVSADSALRLQLKEFIDHAVVKQKRSPEGEEKFLITMDNSILKQFLEEQVST